ncbi:MAG: YceI family protein [Bradymonadia bacterium]
MSRRTRIMSALFCALTLGATVASAAPKKVDLAGQFEFVSDAPLEKIFGTAPEVKGTVETDFDNLAATKGTLTVPVASMKTGNDTRDEHLRSAEWLDAEKFPNITFEIEKAEVKGTEAKGEVKIATLHATGKFTLHGVTTPMTTPVTVKWKGDKVKVEATFEVKLADYQVKGKDGVVGKKVGETIQIKGALKGVAK